MALNDLAVAISYRNKLAQTTLIASSMLFPVWAIIVPIWFSLFLLLLLKIPGAFPLLPAALTLLGLFIIPIVAVLATAVAEDDKIIISKDGLTFPLLFLPQLSFRREFGWKDLTGVHVNWAGETNLNSKDYIDLIFSNRGNVRLFLTKFAKTDLEHLVFALNHLGSGHGEEEHILQLQMHLRGGESDNKRLGITELWEEELASRFSPASFNPLLAGSSLQSRRLKIVKQLGFGGFSATYLAQRDERELVVIKEAASVRTRGTQSASALMQAEASILNKLKHPKIARIYDHFVENDRRYLVIQYVSGQDLRRLVMQNGPQSEASVISWAIDICEILEYLHSQIPSIIHLDLTPENLMLRYDGQIVLVDFGSAREHDLASSSTMSGKQGYTAPEQKDFKPTPQSDIFALGSTLYYLVTGQDPNPEATSQLSEHPFFSPGFAKVLADCHREELDKRLGSASDLKELLKKLASAQPQFNSRGGEI